MNTEPSGKILSAHVRVNKAVRFDTYAPRGSDIVVMISIISCGPRVDGLGLWMRTKSSQPANRKGLFSPPRAGLTQLALAPADEELYPPRHQPRNCQVPSSVKCCLLTD
ncbi:hypothetical protein ACLOJK_009227 [Asimina triloba]